MATEEGQRAALGAFAEAIGVTRRAQLVADLTEVAEDRVLGPDSHGDVLPAIWGPPLSEAGREWAESRNLQTAFEFRAEVLEGSCTTTDVAKMIEVSEQAVTKKLAAGQLVGVKTRGQWAIPAWQIDPNSQTGLVPGIAELAKRFPGGPVALSRWVLRPSPDLGGKSPRELLSGNRVDEVMRVVKALGATAW